MDIAFLGIGLMGRPMAVRLIDAGHRLFLFNRTKEKALPLESKGAVVAKDPRQAIDRAQCVILMLSDYKAIGDTLFYGGDFDLDGKTVIQMGTILPSQSYALKERVEKNKGAYFESPVLGSRDKAETGSLIIMAGSTLQQFEDFEPLLKCFGPEPSRVGDVGQAAALKLALNQLIISLISSFSLSLGIIERSGVAVDDFMAILRKSVLYAPTFDKKLPRMQARDFGNPNFPIKHMLKDVNLILDQTRSCSLEDAVLQSIKQLLAQAIDEGLGEQDYSALFKVINS